MRSKIFNGHVEHVRHTPAGHRFRTPVIFYALDLEELETLDREVVGFGFNRFAPVHLRSRHFLNEGDASLREKLAPWIERCGLDAEPDRITLVTSPRWFGYVFNPVHFYLLETDGDPRGMIAEVNNTFGDRHVYAVPLEHRDGIDANRHPKEFHVSPFNNMEGDYRFTLRRDGDDLYIGVDLMRNGERVLDAWIEGKGRPLTSPALWKTHLLHPLRPWLTMPRIAWQAGLLKFRKHLPVFPRPEPRHPHTLMSRRRPR